MSRPGERTAEAVQLASTISRLLRSSRRTVAVAESLTSGMVAAHLGAAEAASEWFRGGVVAYSAEVKFAVLGVRKGPVISATCAEQMASGVARLMGADFGLAVTGAGGPGNEEGKRPGTVFVAVYSTTSSDVREFAFRGDPERVVEASIVGALELCRTTIEGI